MLDTPAYSKRMESSGKTRCNCHGKNDECVETDSRQVQFEESGRTISIQKTGKKADPMVQLYHTGSSYV